MHEYYVTAEIFEKNPTRIASANTNVKNPDYKPEAKKQTPAQQKGPSKKEEKGIFDSASDVLHDYYETSVSVLNEIG
ncbi:hypothetical protein KHA90_08985 [Flavobacterium psychroterrae]|uniref:Uncharacterized protein n=1 Tax=Flavobacterium psychroterrae TaxID=2133767 RepID=A0ABS5PA51_9FLAO|nr:hypothetical protein [Flavobacterium psychroterrae]MBS7231159.1 hypothetical protein [Flavobacterium psychroterrae]